MCQAVFLALPTSPALELELELRAVKGWNPVWELPRNWYQIRLKTETSYLALPFVGAKERLCLFGGLDWYQARPWVSE